jgi:hypothetical protein
MKSIDNMLGQFKEVGEITAYAQAQYQTILSLSKKITELEEKNTSLEAQLLNTSPINKNPDEESKLIISDTDEETICRIELKKLRDRSISGIELTLEETKRVEIYTKLLLAISEKKKKSENIANPIDDSKLMELLMSPNFANEEVK